MASTLKVLRVAPGTQLLGFSDTDIFTFASNGGTKRLRIPHEKIIKSLLYMSDLNSCQAFYLKLILNDGSADRVLERVDMERLTTAQASTTGAAYPFPSAGYLNLAREPINFLQGFALRAGDWYAANDTHFQAEGQQLLNHQAFGSDVILGPNESLKVVGATVSGTQPTLGYEFYANAVEEDV